MMQMIVHITRAELAASFRQIQFFWLPKKPRRSARAGRRQKKCRAALLVIIRARMFGVLKPVFSQPML